MSSNSADGGDAQTRDCPDCGEEMTYDAIREHGTEFETTLYQGWWCSSCVQGMVECGECDSLHHPDFECEPKQEARIEAAREDLGGKAKLPRYGVVSLEECDTIDDGTPVYIVEDRCPNHDCDGDLVFRLVRNDDFTDRYPHEITFEYEAVLEYCTEFEDGDCSYHKP
ncbi:hypothetical protein [Halococcus sp. PRR34]|uniref:hypothetical protein n=1 Tax=Halococcus sp. PRR34 TaxID=3020830 RepID=UPI002360F4DC|nr:hypothetical protein [Halococcus sp. PRR34]